MEILDLKELTLLSKIRKPGSVCLITEFLFFGELRFSHYSIKEYSLLVIFDYNELITNTMT